MRECYKGGIVDDGCDLALTLYTYDLRKGDLFVELGNGVTSEVGKYLLRVANVW